MSWYWTNPANGRWYQAELTRDLFTPVVMDLSWGGAGRPRSGNRSVPVKDRPHLRQLLHDVRVTRRRHGYSRSRIRN